MDIENINDIVSSLSNEDIERLQLLANSIMNSDAPPESSVKKTLPAADSGELEMLMKAKKIMNKMNNTGSKDAGLILALKPYLSEEKRQRADQSIKMLQLFEILPYLKELF